MWIKGNNGSLINMDKIMFIHSAPETEGCLLRMKITDGTFYSFGFKSAERCQEIIDEIQSHIEFVEYTKNYNTGLRCDYGSYQSYKVVYEMPKE